MFHILYISVCVLPTLPPTVFSHVTSPRIFIICPLSEICAGRAARAAVRDCVPVPEGGGRTHLCVWGCHNGRGCPQDHPADYQTAGQHEPGGRRLLHQQAAGKRQRHRRDVYSLSNLERWRCEVTFVAAM